METGNNGYNPEQKPTIGNLNSEKRGLPSPSSPANKYLQNLVYGNVDFNSDAGDGIILPQKKGLIEIQENDFNISSNSLMKYFIGNDRKMTSITAAVLKENPEIKVVGRSNGTGITKVIPDKESIELYMKKMQEAGVELRDKNVLEVQKDDFQIATMALVSNFVGRSGKLNEISGIVLRDNPEIRVIKRALKRSDGSSIITKVIPDKESIELYMKKMQEAGVGLRSKDIQEMQEGDFQLTADSILSTFSVGYIKLNQILKAVIKENPEIKVVDRVTKKSDGSNAIVQVISGKESIKLFMQRMREAGVKLRDKNILEVQKDDFQISKKALMLNFIGSDRELTPTVKRILKENPEIKITNRMLGSNFVQVISDRESLELFMKKMQETGVRLRDNNIAEVQEDDFLFTVASLESTFIGGRAKINSAIEKVLKENPEIKTANKMHGSNYSQAISDKESLELFMKKMQEAGVEMQDKNILELQKEDLPITGYSLNSMFAGSRKKLMTFAEEVLKENPKIVSEYRKVGKAHQRIRAINSKESQEMFLHDMKKKGVKERRDLLKVQENDLPLTDDSFRLVFIGTGEKVTSSSNVILREHPEIKIEERKVGSRIIKVIVDKESQELYKKKMQEAGVKLRSIKLANNEQKNI